MCFEEKNEEIKRRFLNLAMKKRFRNKRKRDPDMHVDVLLSCTVKRLKCEIVNMECKSKPWKEREISLSCEEKVIEDLPESVKEEPVTENDVEIAKECLQSTVDTLDPEEEIYPVKNTNASKSLKNTQCTVNSSFNKDTRTLSDTKLPRDSVEFTNCEDLDFDTLMQSLLEICDPPTCNMDELMKEYSIDPNNSGPFDLLSSNDPFLPGLFEVMCS